MYQRSGQDSESKADDFHFSQNALEKSLDEFFSTGARRIYNGTPSAAVSHNFVNNDQQYGNDSPNPTFLKNANDGYDNSMTGNYKQSDSSFSRADNKQDCNAWNKNNGGVGNSRGQDDYDMCDNRPMYSQQRFGAGNDRSENMLGSGTKGQFHDQESSWYGSSQRHNEKYDYSIVENEPKSRSNQNRVEEVGSARGQTDFNFQRNQVDYSRGNNAYDFRENLDRAEEVGNFNVTTRDGAYNKNNQQQFAGDNYSRNQNTSDISCNKQQNFEGGDSFATFDLQNNRRNISEVGAGGYYNNFYSNQQTRQFASNKQNNLGNSMETNWTNPQSSHQMNRNDFGSNSNYQAPLNAVNPTRTPLHNSNRKIGSSTNEGSWQRENDISKKISNKKNLDERERLRRRSAKERDREYQDQIKSGIAKKASKNKTKIDPEGYWKVWWSKYAYIENMIPIVDENDPEVKDFVKFTHEPGDQRFERKMKLLLKIGTSKIRRNLDITEANYEFRDMYKLFMYKKHLEDPNFQKHLNKQEKDHVLKTLALLQHKGKYTLMLQSLISRWDFHQKSMAGLTNLGRGKNALNMMNTKLFHYLVMDSIQELKNMCAMDWNGFTEFHRNLLSMPPPHYASTDNILTKTIGHMDGGGNNSDMDNADE